jgi:hypothetical protein
MGVHARDIWAQGRMFRANLRAAVVRTRFGRATILTVPGRPDPTLDPVVNGFFIGWRG